MKVPNGIGPKWDGWSPPELVSRSLDWFGSRGNSCHEPMAAPPALELPSAFSERLGTLAAGLPGTSVSLWGLAPTSVQYPGLQIQQWPQSLHYGKTPHMLHCGTVFALRQAGHAGHGSRPSRCSARAGAWARAQGPETRPRRWRTSKAAAPGLHERSTAGCGPGSGTANVMLTVGEVWTGWRPRELPKRWVALRPPVMMVPRRYTKRQSVADLVLGGVHVGGPPLHVGSGSGYSVPTERPSAA